jgi:hypothetical protein
MAKLRAPRQESPNGFPSPQEPVNGLVTMPGLAAALGVNLRALQRAQTEGVIVPARPRCGSRPAGWDVVDVARALLRHRAQEQPRDRRETAQAMLLELRFKRESREVLARADVVRRGQAVAKVVTAHLTGLPARMVRDGILPPEGEAAAATYVGERLDELARLADAGYLAGGDE